MKERIDPIKQAADWWSTDIIEMAPGVIRFHGYPIQDLIGNLSFSSMIWLMLKGTTPSAEQERLFNAALMAGVDHGPQAPSIAIARIASTCGVGINNAMASAANVLGDVHGGAGEQCLEILEKIKQRIDKGQELTLAVDEELIDFYSSGKKYIPGFGHRFHPIDPRSKPLLDLLEHAEKMEVVSGDFSVIIRALENGIQKLKGKLIPINIDGATAAIYGSLGFPAPLCRGLFVLSRSVGILAHVWEQSQTAERNKGPMPKDWLWNYTGVPLRSFSDVE